MAQYTWLSDSSLSLHTFEPLISNGLLNWDSVNYKWGEHSEKGSYLLQSDASYNDWAFGLGDFSIEFWVRRGDLTPGPGYRAGIIGNMNAWGGGWKIVFDENNSIALWAFVTGGTKLANASFTFDTTSWYHFVMARQGNTIAFFVDGTRTAVSTGWSNRDFDNLQPLVIGREYYNYSVGSYAGNLDDVRILKGRSAYDVTDSTITVPTASFPDGDEAEANTVLTLHFEEIFDASFDDGIAVSDYANVYLPPNQPLNLSVYDAIRITENPTLPLDVGQSVYQAWYGYTDEGTTTTNGSPILYIEEGRKEDGGQPLNNKLCAEVEVVAKGTTGAYDLFVYVAFDDGPYNLAGVMSLKTTDNSDAIGKFHLDSHGSWRYARVKLFQGTPTGEEEVTISETNIFGFVDEYAEEDE